MDRDLRTDGIINRVRSGGAGRLLGVWALGCAANRATTITLTPPQGGTISGDGMEIRLEKNNKGEKSILVADLVYCLCAYAEDSAKAELLERLIGEETFAPAFKLVIKEAGDEANKLRGLMIEHADVAANELIKSLTNQVLNLTHKLSEADKFVKKILSEWPDPYAKYKPQQDWSCDYTYITDRHVVKMLEIVREGKEQP